MLNSTRRVWLSIFSNFRPMKDPAVKAAVAGSLAYGQWTNTSSALNGLPSCHVTPRLSFQSTDLPSAASPPLARLGTSVTSSGTMLASASNSTIGS